MKYIYILSLICVFISCKKDLKNNKEFSKPSNDSYIQNKIKQNIVKDFLPIGNHIIIEKQFDTLSSIYINTSNGIELKDSYKVSENNRKDLDVYFKKKYKPSKKSSYKEDKYPLFEDKDYINKISIKYTEVAFFLPKIGDYYVIIVNVFFDYDREYDSLIGATKYLVLLDNQLKIKTDFNLSFFHETEGEIFAKFFYIDKNYSIYTRYYTDTDDKSFFSRLYKYTVIPRGEILKQKE